MRKISYDILLKLTIKSLDDMVEARDIAQISSRGNGN